MFILLNTHLESKKPPWIIKVHGLSIQYWLLKEQDMSSLLKIFINFSIPFLNDFCFSKVTVEVY